ncbi:MAG: site-specific integrase [Candidatus Omnitrophica bacterium]|nr:site-specific integrase [Candidatus Omnitrophota bacterium]
MRWSEIANLKWRRAPESNYVDLEHDMIFIHESLTKSKKSRWIPLNEFVKQELMKMPRQKATDYIFFNPKTNKPQGSMKNAYQRAVVKAKLKDFHFHGLRHTFASQLVRDGVDLYVVQKLLGHTSPVMTQRYAHLSADVLKNAIQKIGRKIPGKKEDVMYNVDSETNTGEVAEKNSTFLAHLPDLRERYDNRVYANN